MTCVFSEIVAERVPANVVAENGRALAFMDAHPAADGHVHVVPRRFDDGFVDPWPSKLADGDRAELALRLHVEAAR